MTETDKPNALRKPVLAPVLLVELCKLCKYIGENMMTLKRVMSEKSNDNYTYLLGEIMIGVLYFQKSKDLIIENVFNNKERLSDANYLSSMNVLKTLNEAMGTYEERMLYQMSLMEDFDCEVMYTCYDASLVRMRDKFEYFNFLPRPPLFNVMCTCNTKKMIKCA